MLSRAKTQDKINLQQAAEQQKDPLVAAIAQIFYEQIQTDQEKPIPFTNQYFCQKKYIESSAELLTDSQLSHLQKQITEQELYESLSYTLKKLGIDRQESVMVLVLILKLTRKQVIVFSYETWRGFVLIAELLTKKFFFDQPVSVQEICDIFPVLRKKDVALMESKMLQLLDYKLYITGKLFHQFLFELNNQESSSDQQIQRFKSATESYIHRCANSIKNEF